MSRNRVANVVSCLGWTVVAGCTRRLSDQEIAAHIKAVFYSDPDLNTSSNVTSSATTLGGTTAIKAIAAVAGTSAAGTATD